MAEPTPKYKSFKLARGKYGVWWMYGWRPTLALIAIFGLGWLAWHQALTRYGIDNFWAVVIGFVGGGAVGILYNLVAKKRGWQRLHPLDILIFDWPW